jgi:hypothetical protein
LDIDSRLAELAATLVIQADQHRYEAGRILDHAAEMGRLYVGQGAEAARQAAGAEAARQAGESLALAERLERRAQAAGKGMYLLDEGSDADPREFTELKAFAAKAGRLTTRFE